MGTSASDLGATVKARAEEIVSSGTDIRTRLTEVVTQNARQSRQSDGLLTLVRAAIEGTREGLARAVPQDRDDVLRQVVDALGDGLAKLALAAQLTLQEAAGASRQYTGEDLARLRDDLTAVRGLFAETVDRGLTTCKALTAGQVSTARGHAERVAERLGPAVTRVLDAVRQHPLVFAREGLQAGVSAGQCGAGSLFQALGRMLQPDGDQVRREREPKGTS